MVIPVDLHWYIISQIFGVVALACFFVAMQVKNKSKLLVIMAIGSFFGAVMYLFLEMYFLASLWFIGVFRSLAFAWVDKNREKLPKYVSVGVLVFFVAALVTATAFTWESWISWAILGFSLITVVLKWVEGYMHLMRGGIVVKAVLSIIVNAFKLNVTGIIIEVNYIISISVFYIRLYREKRIKKVAPIDAANAA